MTKSLYKLTAVQNANTESGKFVRLFNIAQYGIGLFYLYAGDFVTNNSYTLYSAIISINNRSQTGLYCFMSALKLTSVTLFLKRNENNSIDVYVKIPEAAFHTCQLRWIYQSDDYRIEMIMSIDDTVSEENLTKYVL